MKIKISKNTDELSQFFAELIIEGTKKIGPTDLFSMSLSGGSTPKAIFNYLATNYKEKIEWNKIKIFWGDERCVAPENEESNYKMTNDFLLKHVSIPNKNIYRIKGENNPEIESHRYAEITKEQIRLNRGIPQFDLIMLGLGEDGHTASIFPDNLKLFENDNLFAPAQNPYNKQVRISATGKLINNASLIVFLVTGESKAEMVSRIINQTEGNLKFPASFVKPLSGDIYWLLDEKAASKLKK
jgi:6-phosphogluconolactonase